jgi:DNA-binding transcriptional regulator YiaG
MAFCASCFSDEAVVSLVDLPAEKLGLPSGMLHGVEQINCDCGEVSYSIPAHGAVMKQYRQQLAKLNRPLTPPEFAYLRRALRLSGQDYAEALNITNVTISRAENGGGISSLQDGMIRALTLLDSVSDSLSSFLVRSGDQVIVDVRAVEKTRTRDLSGGWRSFDFSPLPHNVIPFRRRSLSGEPLVYEIFEETFVDVSQERSIPLDSHVQRRACR